MGSDGSPSRGDWIGIYLYGYSTNEGIGEFDYCRVRYGGGAGTTNANLYFNLSDSGHFTNSISEQSAIDGIRILDCSPRIDASTVSNNANDGLYASGSGAPLIAGNTFTGNTRHGLYLNQTNISPNISGNTGSGNGTDGVVLAGTVAAEQSWSSESGFPIVLLSSVTVADNVRLTVTAGTIIKFGSSAQLYVLGTLDANGSAGNWVVFTSLKDDDYGGDTNGDGASSIAAPGDWTGIYLYGYSTNEGIGEFDYCRVRYGGGTGGTNANLNFNLSDSGHFTNSISEQSAIDGIRILDCSPRIDASTISNNANDGLYASGSGAPLIAGNTFTGNTRHGLYLNQTNISPNISGNTGSGNGTDGVVLAGTVAAEQSWSSESGFPIVLLSSVTVADNVRLTVTAGTVIKFGPSVRLLVLGTLDANGSAGNWVVFTSLKDDDYGGDTNGDGESSIAAPGDWTGIFLYGYSTNEGVGEFDYCRVRYGGGTGGTNANLNFNLSESGHFTNSISEQSAIDGIRILDCSPRIDASTISNNANDGLYASGSGAPLIAGNTFTGNTRHGLYLNQTNISPNISSNTGSGNGTDGVVLAGTVAAEQSWSSESGFPIVLLSSVTVADNVRLTVTAGTVIKFGPSAGLTVLGTLDANGSAENWVVFTSLKDDDYGGDTNGDGASSSAAPGDWTGISLAGYSTNEGVGEFDYCRVRYGGGTGGTSANLYFNLSDSGHFTNSISEQSAIDGILIAGCSPQISNCTFSKSAGHGLTISSGSPTVINSIFWGDGGVEISGSLSVTYSDVQGGYIGEGNINKDPMFLGPDIGDYRLDICSPAIDAGDPIEILTNDYISGEFVLAVDRVTRVAPGDIIWITDGFNFEGDEVVSTSTSTITVLNGFFNSYPVAGSPYLFTFKSDFNDEPPPNGMRINMGAYGGGSEAVPSFFCLADIEGDDQDVDGADLRVFMNAYGTSSGDAAFNPDADINKDGSVDHNDLLLFTAEFGRTDCLFCP